MYRFLSMRLRTIDGLFFEHRPIKNAKNVKVSTEEQSVVSSFIKLES